MLNNTVSQLLQKTDDKKVKYLGCLSQFVKLKTGKENILFQGTAKVSNTERAVFF